MDAELRSLRLRFQQLQNQEVVQLINERNIIEIVNYIHRKKNLVDILYTTDGKEFLTWEQLQREIVDEVYANQGRLNIVDLPSALNVDMTAVERVLPKILSDPLDPLTCHMGQLMTGRYISALTVEANEELKEKGSLSIAYFAKTHQLTSQFVTDLFERAIASREIHGETADNFVYTSFYVRSQRQALLCALVARTRPVNVHELAVRHGINLSLLPTLLKQLDPLLPGDLEGSASGQYVPRVHTQQRLETVTNYYRSNGYITYAHLQRLGVGNPRRFMEATFNGAMTGTATVTSPTVGTGGGGSDKKSSSSGGGGGGRSKGKRGGNAQPTSPHSPSDQQYDFRANSDAHPLAGHPLSQCFLCDKRIGGLAVPLEQLVGQETMFVDVAEHLPLDVDWDADGEIIWKRLNEINGALMASCFVAAQSVLVSRRVFQVAAAQVTQAVDDAVLRTRRAAAEPSPSPKTGSGASRGKPAPDAAPSATSGFVVSDALLAVLGKVCALDLVSRRQVLEDIAANWEPPLDELARAAMERSSNRAAAEVKKVRADLQSRCAEHWTHLCAAQRGLDWVDRELPAADAQAVHRAFLSSARCQALCTDVVAHEALLTSPELYGKVASALPNIRGAIALFDKKKQQPLLSLLDMLQEKSVSKFVTALEELCTSGEIGISSFHQLNKKVEREASAALREHLIHELDTLGNSPTVDVASGSALFSACCTALVAIRYKVPLALVPGKAVAGLCQRLVSDAEFTSQPATGLLDVVRTGVVQCISNKTEVLDEHTESNLRKFQLAVQQEGSS